MKVTNKTVLITGGGSGIGFEIAKLFAGKGNKVIISGKNEKKLKDAVANLRGVEYFVADVTKEHDLFKLTQHITQTGLDILVNNAAVTNIYQLGIGKGMLEKAAAEIAVNYLAIVSLTEKLLPILAQEAEAAIVNVNAIIGLTPSVYMPTHSASKAALRAFTQVLRQTLTTAGSPVKIFELTPPLVDTDFSRPLHQGGNAMSPAAVAEALWQGLESDTPEIRIGFADTFYKAFFAGSDGAVAALNAPRK